MKLHSIKLLLGIVLFTNLQAQPKKSLLATKPLSSKAYNRIYEEHKFVFKLNNTHIGFNMGTLSYWGDLQSRNLTWSQSKLAGGIELHNHLHKNWAARMMLNYGRIGADDSKSENLDRVRRNLSFRSHIIELGLALEYHIFLTKDNPRRKQEAKTYFKLSPYLVGGINVFHFNPQANYLGTWYDLQPLNTEGQSVNFMNSRKYKRTQLSIPFGMGLQYKHSNSVTFKAEVGFRKTFTDYLDDVSTYYPDQALLAQTDGSLAAKLSWRGDEIPGREQKKIKAGIQRGHSDNNDWYVMSNVGIRVRLKNKN